MGKVIKRGLGRGLNALIPEVRVSTNGGSYLEEVDINSIIPNPNQPREHFSLKALEDLAISIKEYGVTQPILVRRGREGKYELIAGERRWRASRIAGKERIPALIKDVDDRESIELALIENIQRENLSPLEEAEVYRKLQNEYYLTQDEIGNHVGKSRSVVANVMRLLDLPDEIRDSLRKNDISTSHARTLLSLENQNQQIELWRRILAENLNVRDVEGIVNQNRKPSETKTKVIQKDTHFENKELKNLENTLSEVLHTKVQIKGNQNTGKIEIHYFSLSDLERIADAVMPKLKIEYTT